MPDARPEPYGVRGGARTTHRRGRMSTAKRAVLEELGPRWSISPADVVLPDRVASSYGRVAPLLVDIGGGMGEATRAWATQHPDHDVVAVELHRPGLARVLKELDLEGPTNVRVVEADATALMAQWPEAWLAGIRVLFPDPWPKRRHVDRRLVDTRFIHRAADLLAPGGVLHLATDWPEYADQMRACLATEPRLVGVVDVVDQPKPLDETTAEVPAGEPWRSHRPDRPVTAYEARGSGAGRPIADLLARRV